MIEENGYSPDAPAFGSYEGECAGCDVYGPVNDVGLCSTCAPKLERDLIRKRDWDYSVSAYGLPDDAREELRKKVIAQYGRDLELIADDPPKRKTGKKKHKRRRRNRRKSPRQ